MKDRYFRFHTWVCQNVSNEVLLAWFKFQTKIPSRSGVCIQGEWQKYTPPSPPLCKDERLRGMNTEQIQFWDSVVLRFHIWFIMTVSYDMQQILWQNATAILLQNATEVYYRMCQGFYYKMRELLENATILLQNATVITKCDVCYKLRQYTHVAEDFC